MSESFSQRRAREQRKLERLKQVKEFVRSADHRLSLKEIRSRFDSESERTIERDLSVLVELGDIGYDQKEKLYWISNVELIQASEQQMKALAGVAYETLGPAVGNLIQLAKTLDPENLGKMSDKRALSYMLQRVNDDILKSSEKKRR